MREQTTRSTRPGLRGQSELVGIVLLFGMVIAAAGIVFVAGTSAIDSAQQEAEVGQLELTSEAVDEQLGIVANDPDTSRSLPDNEHGQYNVTEDQGEVQIAWYDDDTQSDPDWDESNDWTSDSAHLGALKLEHDKVDIVHQGGGTWRKDNGGMTMETPPGIAYDGERLTLKLMQVQDQNFDSVNPSVSYDPDATEDLLDTLQIDPDGYPPHFALRIQTEYVDAWEHALEAKLDADGHSNVDVYIDSAGGEEFVVAEVEGLYNLDGEGEIVVDEDNGLTNGIGDQRVELNPGGNLPPNLDVEVELFNTAIEERSANSIEAVYYKDGTEIERSNPEGPIDLDGRENQTLTLDLPSGKLNPDVDPGVYEYDIEIDGESQLDTRGKIYIGEEGSDVQVEDIDATVSDETVEITATLQNIGVEDTADPYDVEYELDGEAELDGTRTINGLDWGGETTLEWTIDELPEGDHTFTVDIDDDDKQTSFEIQNGALPQGIYIEEDRGVGQNQRVDVTDEAEFDVALWNTGDSTASTDLTVTIYDDSGVLTTVTREAVEVEDRDEAESKPVKTVEVPTQDLETSETYEYTIETDDDEFEERGSFYAGQPGTQFELYDANATVTAQDAGTQSEMDTVNITVDLENVGIEAGPAELDFDLQYEDGETPDEYDIEPVVTDEFQPGQSGQIDWMLNRSRLYAGNHSVTVNDEVTTEFDVSTDLDPGRTGISGIRNANVTSEVIGTQTSYPGTNDPHITAPIEFEVRAEGEETGIEQDLHEFRNHDGGTNLNTGPTWQSNEYFDSYSKTVQIDEAEDVTLSLRAEFYNDYCGSSCTETDPGDIENFDDGSVGWQTDSSDNADQVVDPVGDEELRRVRVRNSEDNAVPILPAGTEQQISAIELLDRRGFVEEQGEDFATLDLEDNEFIFLFQLTSPEDNWDDYIDEDTETIDEFWEAATNAAEDPNKDTFDPNFNDAVVYVEVEHAPVEISNPLIDIDPVKTDPVETGSGDGGEINVSNPQIVDEDESSDDGPDTGPGESEYYDPVEEGPDVDVNVDAVSIQ